MTRRLRVLRYAGLAASLALAGLAYVAGALPSGDPAYNLRAIGFAAMSAGFRWGTVGCVAAAVVWLVVWGRLTALTAGTGTGRRSPDRSSLSGMFDSLRMPEQHEQRQRYERSERRERPGRSGKPGLSGPGGPLGLRWVAVTGTLWTLPLMLAPPLASRDVYSYACQGWLYARGADPYAVGPAAGSCPWLGEVAPLWRETTAPYGSLWVALSASAASPADALPLDTRSRLLLIVCLLRVFALIGVVLAGWGGARLALACGGSPVRAVLFGSLAPLVGLHAISGAHNDALMAGLVVAGLAVIAGRAPGDSAVTLAAVSAGVALGLATAIKVTAVVAVPFAVVLAVRAVGGGGRGPWVRATTAVGGGAVGAYGTAMALTGLGFGWLGALGATAQGTQWTSVPTAFGMSGGYVARAFGWPAGVPIVVGVARGIGVAVLAGILIALWSRSVRQRSSVRAVSTCCGLALVAVAALSPVFYPWYALTALAVLGASTTSETARRRLVLAGSALTLLVLPNGLGVAAITKAQGAVAVTLVVSLIVFRWLRRQREVAEAGVLVADAGPSPAAANPSPVTAGQSQAAAGTGAGTSGRLPVASSDSAS